MSHHCSCGGFVGWVGGESGCLLGLLFDPSTLNDQWGLSQMKAYVQFSFNWSQCDWFIFQNFPTFPEVKQSES